MDLGQKQQGKDEEKTQDVLAEGARVIASDGDSGMHETETAIGDDEVEMIGDLGNEDDDPDGWMSERARYWTDLASASQPTRAAMLRHRIAECFGLLRLLACEKSLDWPSDRIPESAWRKAADEVFGYGDAKTGPEQSSAKPGSGGPSGEANFADSNPSGHVLRTKSWLLRSASSANHQSHLMRRKGLDWPPRPSHLSDGAG